MKSTTLLVAVLAGCFLCPASPAVAESGIAEGAPAELSHWAKLIGNWSTTEERLAPDGSEWLSSKSADWSFEWSFDGWGVRDNYTSPPMSMAVDDESKRQRGTNLRIFNTETQQWVMTWLTISATEPVSFTATSTDDEIVMLSDVANPRGFFGRITFFDMTGTSFEWKLEWSRDKEQWTEVYRIHGSREAD